MLTQRRKYNYMVGSSLNSSKHRATSGCKFQNQNLLAPAQSKQLYNHQASATAEAKRIAQLQQTNKRMLEETTKQFQKFEADVLKVEGILRVKEDMVGRLEQEKGKLLGEKAVLVDALKEKEAIIKEYQAKIMQILKQKQSQSQKTRQPQTTQTSILSHCPTRPQQTQTEQSGSPIRQPSVSQQQYTALKSQLEETVQKYQQQRERTANLEDQVYKLKEQVYLANSQLDLCKQEFSTFTLLHQIDLAKKM